MTLEKRGFRRMKVNCWLLRSFALFIVLGFGIAKISAAAVAGNTASDAVLAANNVSLSKGKHRRKTKEMSSKVPNCLGLPID